MTPGEVFKQLWHAAEEELRPHLHWKGGAPVSYNCRLGADDGDEAAYTRAARCIWLYREEGELPTCVSRPDGRWADRDACLLAHEFGHALSHIVGSVPERYDAANDGFIRGDACEEVDINAVLDEERTAWRLARERLHGLGVTDWSLFDSVRQDGLDAYEARATSLLAKHAAKRRRA